MAADGCNLEGACMCPHEGLTRSVLLFHKDSVPLNLNQIEHSRSLHGAVRLHALMLPTRDQDMPIFKINELVHTIFHLVPHSSADWVLCCAVTSQV